jgi:hypothetical protein
MKNRENIRKRKSGGIILGFKEEMKDYMEVINQTVDICYGLRSLNVL